MVAIYEFSIAIFKQSGELLQEIKPHILNKHNQDANKFKYFKAVVNPAGDNEIILLAANTKEGKNLT